MNKEIYQSSNETQLSEENVRSIDILNEMQNADWFGLDNSGDILLYDRTEAGFKPNGKRFKVEHFLEAVDYYATNREAEFFVDRAMKQAEGVVRVYAPHTESSVERPVVLELKNYMVPQILELGYLSVRQSGK